MFSIEVGCSLNSLCWVCYHCPVEVGFTAKMGGSVQEERSLYYMVELTVKQNPRDCGQPTLQTLGEPLAAHERLKDRA